MRIRDEFPYGVIDDDVRIPLEDGTRLYARIWRPVTAEPVPALLEYLPYRLTDGTAQRDAQRHPWYAGHGYASVRVDIRGNGNSDGVMTDEYSEQEIRDGVAVVEWLARQRWCNGRVGMFGISWGGFNALQVAGRAPEALKAIVTVCSSDDRYDNDVHYMGGAVLGGDMHAWAATMLAFTARPPDPRYAGARWRDQWLARLDMLEPFNHTWLAHQRRDEYWRHGSVREDYGSIRAAVLAVGGWHDPYRDTVFRLVEHLGEQGTAVRGLIGPWSHQYPDRGLPPGPAIGFLQETLRWWDHWLKGIDSGVLEDAPLRSWICESVPPATMYRERPGRWVGDASWPSAQVTMTQIALAQPVDIADARLLPVHSPEHTGVDAGRFLPIGNPGDLPPDQRAEDGRSVCFDTAPLIGRIEILGRPGVRLRVTCPAERANVIARLCDVAPDGTSTLVSRGVLNLQARDGRDRITPWRPGEGGDIEFELSSAGYAFPPGHRIRVALSSAYWPWIWPHPEGAGYQVDPANSVLTLPVRDPAADRGRPEIAFFEPEQAEPLEVRVIRNEARTARPLRAVARDVAAGLWALDVDPGYTTAGTRVYPDGLELTESARERYWIQERDPLSARARSDWSLRLRREELAWDARVVTVSETRCTATAYIVDNSAQCYDGDQLVFERNWHKEIPR
jgi:hypothetical protein